MALLVALGWPRKSPHGVRRNSSILLIPHVIADTLPAKAGDPRLPESLIGSAPHLLGDGDIICISLDFKAHRGFARNPLAGPKIAAGYPPELPHPVDSTNDL